LGTRHGSNGQVDSSLLFFYSIAEALADSERFCPSPSAKITNDKMSGDEGMAKSEWRDLQTSPRKIGILQAPRAKINGRGRSQNSAVRFFMSDSKLKIADGVHEL
jgi:hypothetical protein